MVFPESGYVLGQEPVSQVEAIGGVEVDHLFDQAYASCEEEPILPTGQECDLQLPQPECQPLCGRTDAGHVFRPACLDIRDLGSVGVRGGRFTDQRLETPEEFPVGRQTAEECHRFQAVIRCEPACASELTQLSRELLHRAVEGLEVTAIDLDVLFAAWAREIVLTDPGDKVERLPIEA